MPACTDRASPARSRMAVSFPAAFRNFKVGTVSITVSMSLTVVSTAGQLGHPPHRFKALFHILIMGVGYSHDTGRIDLARGAVTGEDNRLGSRSHAGDSLLQCRMSDGGRSLRSNPRSIYAGYLWKRSEQLSIKGNGWLETVAGCSQGAHIRARNRD